MSIENKPDIYDADYYAHGCGRPYQRDDEWLAFFGKIADRIVQDAIINKIGTFNIAVIANEYEVPFYVAAPKSTFDLSKKSNDLFIPQVFW